MQGIFGWFNKNLRGRQGQKGFTLIELLVVVTILGILAGIVTLSLVGLTTHASVQSCNQEYKTVQAALDSYMANNNLTTLPVNAHTDLNGAQATFTNDMTGTTDSVALYNAAPTSTSPNYTRNGTTQFFYTWDQYGKITDISSNTSTGGHVSGCTPK